MDSSYILMCVFALVVIGFIAAAVKSVRDHDGFIPGGIIEVNRNDPTKDLVLFHLDTYPDDWKDGDVLIFTVKEHVIEEVKDA